MPLALSQVRVDSLLGASWPGRVAWVRVDLLPCQWTPGPPTMPTDTCRHGHMYTDTDRGRGAVKNLHPIIILMHLYITLQRACMRIYDIRLINGFTYSRSVGHLGAANLLKTRMNRPSALVRMFWQGGRHLGFREDINLQVETTMDYSCERALIPGTTISGSCSVPVLLQGPAVV